MSGLQARVSRIEKELNREGRGFYDEGHRGKSYALGECDYCGLRFGVALLVENVVCSTCAASRLARIRACAERLTRHRDVEGIEPEVMEPVLDVTDEPIEVVL